MQQDEEWAELGENHVPRISFVILAPRNCLTQILRLVPTIKRRKEFSNANQLAPIFSFLTQSEYGVRMNEPWRGIRTLTQVRTRL